MVRVLGAGRPDLLAVHHPLVTIGNSPRLKAGQVGTGPGLTEQLAPVLLTSGDRGQQSTLLGVCTELENDRRAHLRSRPTRERRGARSSDLLRYG